MGDDTFRESRKCSDCGHRWQEVVTGFQVHASECNATDYCPSCDVPTAEAFIAEAREAVKRLKDEDCGHRLYEVTSEADFTETRVCKDCGHEWLVNHLDDAAADLEAAGPRIWEPPAQISTYGRAQIITLQLEGGEQRDIVVPDLSLVSIQNGVVMIQPLEGAVRGIVGLRPYLVERQEVPDAVEAEDQRPEGDVPA